MISTIQDPPSSFPSPIKKKQPGWYIYCLYINGKKTSCVLHPGRVPPVFSLFSCGWEIEGVKALHVCAALVPSEPQRSRVKIRAELSAVGRSGVQTEAGNASIIPESLQRADCSRCAYYRRQTDSHIVVPSSGITRHYHKKNLIN